MKDYTKIIGIDSGLSGGIAIYKKGQAFCSKMPKTKVNGKNCTDIQAIHRMMIEHTKDDTTIVFIEKVQQFMSDSSGENAGKQFRIQQMLRNYEGLLSVFKIFGYDYVEVPPITWQSYLHLRKKGLSKKERKDKYKRAASGYFPTIKVNLNISDAICIAEYGRRVLMNDPNSIQLPPEEEQMIF